MTYLITASHLHPCRVELPASKSIVNRMALLDAMTGQPRSEAALSCDDTRLMAQALQSTTGVVDIHDTGTAMRFLTAYYAALPGAEVTLTGSARMQQRPIGELVEALRKAGACIEYAGTPGYPPLRITGTQLQGGDIAIRGDISSQFITALLLVAPTMRRGLRLTIEGRILSQSYIDMTLRLMHGYGAQATIDRNVVTVQPGAYRAAGMKIEHDWSAASYWYQIAAIARVPVTLPGLQQESLQGDAAIARYALQLGVATQCDEQGVTLTPCERSNTRFEADLSSTPDIAQTLAMTCALTGTPFTLTGLHNLTIKETDRIAALISEAARLGYDFVSPAQGVLRWEGAHHNIEGIPCIDPHGDHRMAMAFAPAAIVHGAISITNPGVVAKSYPTYWEHLQQAGFDIKPSQP